MSNIASTLTDHVAGILRSENGVGAVAAELALEAGLELPRIGAELIMTQFGPPAESAAHERYPAIYIACEKLSNTLMEKGRRFSGKARFSVECRVSQDRLEGLEARLRVLADAVAESLYERRGNWMSSGFYAGAYEILIAPPRRGGKNVVQTAKVIFDVDVSTN